MTHDEFIDALHITLWPFLDSQHIATICNENNGDKYTQ